MVTLNALDAELTLSSLSDALALIACVIPDANSLVVICQFPPVAVPVPITVAPPPT
ncbi:hypothetical protein JCM18904_1082 [Vibrio sp. JCM 18904]|nr:hypothetical protein JCM18904_1082 [Vibrio sp. JCM 18904]